MCLCDTASPTYLAVLAWRPQVIRDAVSAVEQDGIVFLDEIDKIVVNQDTRYGEQPLSLSLSSVRSFEPFSVGSCSCHRMMCWYS